MKGIISMEKGTYENAKENNAIRVTVIQREFAKNQLSVYEFLCQNLEEIKFELKKRYSLDMDEHFILPILDGDECSYAGLLDMEFGGGTDKTVPELINGFSYRVIINCATVAPRDYAFAESPDEY